MVIKLLTTNQVFTPGCWHVANVLIYFLLGGRRLFSCTVLYSCTQVDLTAWGQEWLSVFSWHLERKHQFPNTWEGWPINSCNFLFHILKLHNVANSPKMAKRLKHNHFRSLISTKDTYLRVKKFQIILKDFISPKLSTSVIFNGHSHTIIVIQFVF